MIDTYQRIWTVAPGNSQILVLMDTTRHLFLGGDTGMSGTAGAAGNSYLIPGPLRGRYPRGMIQGMIRATGQAVTLSLYGMVADTSATTDWDLDSNFATAGSQSCAAGVNVPFEAFPNANEFLLRVDAGGTGPTTLRCDIRFIPTDVRA